jgi:hypothetical protein
MSGLTMIFSIINLMMRDCSSGNNCSQTLSILLSATVTWASSISWYFWDDVHSILAVNGHKRGNYTRAKIPFLLKGMVFAEDGRALTTWSSTKKKSGRRYPKPYRSC